MSKLLGSFLFLLGFFTKILFNLLSKSISFSLLLFLLTRVDADNVILSREWIFLPLGCGSLFLVEGRDQCKPGLVLNLDWTVVVQRFTDVIIVTRSKLASIDRFRRFLLSVHLIKLFSFFLVQVRIKLTETSFPLLQLTAEFLGRRWFLRVVNPGFHLAARKVHGLILNDVVIEFTHVVGQLCLQNRIFSCKDLRLSGIIVLNIRFPEIHPDVCTSIVLFNILRRFTAFSQRVKINSIDLSDRTLECLNDISEFLDSKSNLLLDHFSLWRILGVVLPLSEQVTRTCIFTLGHVLTTEFLNLPIFTIEGVTNTTADPSSYPVVYSVGLLFDGRR